MAGIKSWSKTAGSNNSASPDGFPENMAPSGVNDAAREVMAQVRTWYEDSQWVNLGDTPTKTGNTTFTMPSSGTHTAVYHVDRRLKLLNGSNTWYATVTDQTYAGGTATITVNVDSGDSLTTSLSQVYIAALSAVHPSYPINPIQDALLTPHGQCQLSYTLSATTALRLDQYNGSKIVINSAVESIPDAGVTLAPGVLTPDTLYYIYAYMSGTTMTLEASATAYATQATTGIKIKSGDATRTLVGMAMPSTGPVWTDSAASRRTRSWFNRIPIDLVNHFTASRGTTSTASFAEINSEIRIEWLNWTNEVIYLSVNGSVGITAGTNVGIATTIGIDGATAEDTRSAGTAASSAALIPVGCTLAKSGLSEGYHYATVLGLVGSNTSLYAGTGTAGTRTVLSGFIPGAAR